MSEERPCKEVDLADIATIAKSEKGKTCKRLALLGPKATVAASDVEKLGQYKLILSLATPLHENVGQLGGFKAVESLCLAGNELDGQDAATLVGLGFTHLKELDLADNALGDNGAREIAKLENLAKIDLSRNAIGSRHKDILQEIAQRSDLNLKSNEISQDDLYDIFDPDKTYLCAEQHEKLVEAELRHILGEEAVATERKRLVGLALSGGGVRSASFSLGVLQALANKDRLRTIHYLSTVSGGGYIGSSLSWFIGKAAKDAADGDMPTFDTSRKNFPLGSKKHSALSLEGYDDDRDGSAGRVEDRTGRKVPQVDILDHIRQRGSYLTPKGGLDILKLLATVSRVMIPSFLIYFFALLLPLSLIAYLLAVPPISSGNPFAAPKASASSEIASSATSTGVQLFYFFRDPFLQSGAFRLAVVLLCVLAVTALLAPLSSSVFRAKQSPRREIRDRIRDVRLSGLMSGTSLRKFCAWPASTGLVWFSIFTVFFFILFYALEWPEDRYFIGMILSFLCIIFLYDHVLAVPSIAFAFAVPAILFMEPEFFFTVGIYLYSMAILSPAIWAFLKYETRTFVRHRPDYLSTLIVSLCMVTAIASISSIPVVTSLLNAVAYRDGWMVSLVGGAVASLFVCLVKRFTHAPDDAARPTDPAVDTGVLEATYGVRRQLITPVAGHFAAIIVLSILALLPLIYVETLGRLGPPLTMAGIAAYFGRMVVDVRNISVRFANVEGMLTSIASVGLIVGLLLIGLAICDVLYSYMPAEAEEETVSYFVPIALVSGVALLSFPYGRLANINMAGLHRFYRDRLMETFLPTLEKTEDKLSGRPGFDVEGEKTSADTFFVDALSDTMRGPDRKAPYHLINTNVVLIGSKKERFRERGGSNFIISPLYSGSEATGWRRTETWNMPAGRITLATAMAVSGAAVNPRTGPNGRGPMRTVFVSFLMTLFNARLGLWLYNPRIKRDATALTQAEERQGLLPDPKASPNFINPGFWQGLVGRGYNESEQFIELTDGAHFDNTGLYELIRRQVKLIVLVDVSEDKDFNYGGLASAFERVRADFGVQVRFGESDRELKRLLHDPDGADAFWKKLKLAERGYAIARIDYQPHNDRREEDDGMLVIIKATMIENLPADVLGYKSAHPDFPNESTADQFFDEIQLEAYRELGYRLGKTALNDELIDEEFEYCIRGERPLVGWKHRPAKSVP